MIVDINENKKKNEKIPNALNVYAKAPGKGHSNAQLNQRASHYQSIQPGIFPGGKDFYFQIEAQDLDCCICLINVLYKIIMRTLV